MANEQQRAERIQSDFQKLLAELKKQDEQVAELFDATGADPDDDIEPGERVRELFEREIDPSLRPERTNPELPLRGFVLRG